jgi:hypothetical protein
MRQPWRWGIGFGVATGGAVVALSSVRYGLSLPLLLLGVALALGCGGLAFVAAFGRGRARPE